MIKKVTFLSLLVLISIVALPKDISAKTIKEFENEVAKYTNELQEKKDKLAKNDAEVAKIKKRISEIENQMVQAEQDIKNLQKEIDESNQKIKEKDAESKKLMKYFQVVMNDNAYLEYIFGATSIKDMIYRMSVVEQLTEYNDQLMKELQQLIEENKKKQEQLKKKQEELEGLKAELKDQQERINADSKVIRESMPSIEEQIKEAKSNVNYFKKLGCGATEDILACQFRVQQSTSMSLPSVGTFSRPIEHGSISRGFSRGGHTGYDIVSSNKTIPVYPIASGTVHIIYEDNCLSGNWCNSWTQGFPVSCNGNAKIVVIKHRYGGRYIYSTYMHLSSYGNISSGQFVTKDTKLGNMGTSGCSTGNHLHLEIANCYWKNNGGCTYGNYSSYLINPSSLVALPSSWNNR